MYFSASFCRHIFAAFSYYHTQLALIVHLLAGGRIDDLRRREPRWPKAA